MLFFIRRKYANEFKKEVKPQHCYGVRGFINSPYYGRSFSYDQFPSRKSAENFMYAMINKYNLNVDTNEFADKHTNEVVCDGGRFTIYRIW